MTHVSQRSFFLSSNWSRKVRHWSSRTADSAYAVSLYWTVFSYKSFQNLAFKVSERHESPGKTGGRDVVWRGLTKAQWAAICVHLPRSKPSARGGRPRLPDRRCFEGILWILWTGAQWSELPRRFGSPWTCWRRLRQWEETGVLLKLWRAFLAQLNDQQKLRWDECFADGSFIPAKKGGRKSVSPSAARARSGWFWSMARVLRWEHT